MTRFTVEDGWEVSTIAGVKAWKTVGERTGEVQTIFNHEVVAEVYAGPVVMTDRSYMKPPPKVFAKRRFVFGKVEGDPLLLAMHWVNEQLGLPRMTNEAETEIRGKRMLTIEETIAWMHSLGYRYYLAMDGPHPIQEFNPYSCGRAVSQNDWRGEVISSNQVRDYTRPEDGEIPGFELGIWTFTKYGER